MKSYYKALQRASLQLVDHDALEPDGSGLPNLAVNQAGRPRKRRMRSKAEGEGGRPKKVYKCGICHQAGHDKRNCPNVGS